MARLAAAVAPDLGYVISKGGTTTQTLLAKGLGLDGRPAGGPVAAGAVPGASVRGPLHAGLPILTFPGNLGSADTLRDAWQRMEAG